MSKVVRPVWTKRGGLMSHYKSAPLHFQNGFTYLWVLLLVAFMGVALTLAVEVDQTIVQREREKALLAIGREFRNAIGSYYESKYISGKNEYPATLEDLLLEPRQP